MARKPAARSPNVLRRKPAAIPDQVGIADSLEGEISGASDTIHIDAQSGHVTRKNSDGSISVQSATQERKSRADKRFDDNLAEDIDDYYLSMIASRILEGIEADIQSRREWEQMAEKAVDLLGVKLEEASADVTTEGMISKIKHTGLMQACLSAWASSRAELLPVGGPVKVRDDEQTEDEEQDPSMMGDNGGPPLDDAPDMTNVVPGPGSNLGIAAPSPPKPPAQTLQPGQMSVNAKRADLAQHFENDFNHYLTVVDKDYYPDYSRMLMSRGLLGCQFRKVYRDPLLRRPVSRWVKGTDLIVSNDATSLLSAQRVTERIPTRQNVVKRLQNAGHWRDIPLVIPTTSATGMDRKVADVEGIDPMPRLPADQLHTIYETYTELDVGDLCKDETGRTPGYPLPYRVTIDKDSRQVLEIRRMWKKGDKDHRMRRRYVKYGFVPGLGFYDWGFVHLIGNAQRGATMIERALIDTGMLNSFPGGVMAKTPGTRSRTTEIRPSIGEFIVVDTGGMPISDWVMPWPYKEPSAVLQAMGQDLASQMKQVAGIVELPVGEGRLSNTPVGTIMTYIESISKVPSAVHKDDHIAQQEEFELLKDLFAEDPQALWRDSKKPKHKWMVAQEINDQDLIPAADPNVPSQVHRLMQTNMLVQISGMPQFAGIASQRPVYEQALRTTGWTNTGEFTLPPPPAAAPPPPDPKIVSAQIKAQSQKETDLSRQQTEQQKAAAKSDQLQIESADKAADRESAERRELLKAHVSANETHADVLKHGIGIVADHAQHTDNMVHKDAEMQQDHLHHTNDHIADAAAQAADIAANPPDQGIAPKPDQGT